MHLTRVYNLSLPLLLGLGAGSLLGNPLLGCTFGVLLTVLFGAFYWRRLERGTGQRQAQELLLCQAMAARAIRQGEVGSCWGCKRAVRRDARRCLYCGMHLHEAPLR